MKKILGLTLLLLSFAGSALAAGTALGTHTASGKSMSIYGGIDDTAAGAAPSPLVKLSTNVQGAVNFTSSAGASTGYAIMTKHASGNKYFGTANDSTAIYWKQDAKGDFNVANVGSTAGNDNFDAAGQWTAY